MAKDNNNNNTPQPGTSLNGVIIGGVAGVILGLVVHWNVFWTGVAGALIGGYVSSKGSRKIISQTIKPKL